MAGAMCVESMAALGIFVEACGILVAYGWLACNPFNCHFGSAAVQV
jgi:hypothetical protein